MRLEGVRDEVQVAVGEGVVTLGGMKKATKAASTCGGCGPLVQQLIKAELKRRGVAVNNHLCEHFPYSRQEMFHLVKVGKIENQLSRMGDDSFYLNLLYFDGIKYESDLGLSVEGAFESGGVRKRM